MSTMSHIAKLAQEIGPRGSTTPEEASAARYVEQELGGLGLQPITERFLSARSAWYPYALFSGCAFLGEALFLLGGRAGAALAGVLVATALASVLLELAFRPNPLRWLLPKGMSQNVWVRLPPEGDVRRQVVLLGHLDTHRTPVVFSSARWLQIFGRLVPAGLLSCVLLLVLSVLGAAIGGRPWLAVLSLPPALILLAILALTLQADRTPYSPGANDNATAAGALLTIAERLQAEPLAQTAVYALFSGCEEVSCYGADAFVRAHRGEIDGAFWIPLEMLAERDGDPKYQLCETFLLASPADPELIRLAEQAAARRPELCAGPHSFAGAYSESAIGARHGLRTMTITSSGGSESDWHRPTDTVERLDPEVLARSEAFLWQLLREIDR